MGGTLTMLELACGNGSNSRSIVQGLSQIYPTLKFRVILMDISSTLLKEALERFSKFKEKENPNIEIEAVQLNMLSNTDIQAMLDDYRKSIDFVFSIKFLHNTNVKINNNIAYFISELLKQGGIFATQYYSTINLIPNIKMTLMYILGKKYGNSVLIDRFFADQNLNRNNMKLSYSSKSYNKNLELIKSNHFINYQIENYYVKV